MTTVKQTYPSRAALMKAIRDEVARMDMDGLVGLASALKLNLRMPVASVSASEPSQAHAARQSLPSGGFPQVRAITGLGLKEARQSLPSGRVLQGSGIGPVVSEAKGRRLLDAVTVENESADWVESDLAGAGQVVSLLNISRATLDNWRRAKRVIALRKGLRNFLYPLRQFDRLKPLEGLDTIAALFSSPEDAWEWLVAPNRMTDGQPPIEKLRSGKVQMVRNAAEGALDYA
jgi:hypothetical protein